MQLQSISSQTPNVVSITQIREDIDVLTKALNQFGTVRVLRGQKVMFDAIDPDFEVKRRERIKNAVASIREFAQKNKPKPREKPLSQWLIEERDRMQDPKYYE